MDDFIKELQFEDELAPKTVHDILVVMHGILKFFLEVCRRMKPQSSAAYVLTGTEAFMEPRTLQYRLEKYTQACGLEGVHFHTLRHTFATRAVEVGFEVKSLSGILGHTSVTITLDRYVHASLELKRDNMQKLKVVGL